jgi:hypothetical protein
VDEVIAWATFAGAWLLVARPLWQGSVELNELDLDREGIQAVAVQAAQPRPSAWCRPPHPGHTRALAVLGGGSG